MSSPHPPHLNWPSGGWRGNDPHAHCLKSPEEHPRPTWRVRAAEVRAYTQACSLVPFFFVIIISQYNYICMLMNYGNQPRDRSGVLRGRKSTEVQFHLRSANACRQARLADWPASQTASITAG